MKATYYSTITGHRYPTADHRAKAEEEYIRTLNESDKEQTVNFLNRMMEDCEKILDDLNKSLADLDSEAEEADDQEEIDAIEEDIEELECRFAEWEDRLCEFKHLKNLLNVESKSESKEAEAEPEYSDDCECCNGCHCNNGDINDAHCRFAKDEAEDEATIDEKEYLACKRERAVTQHEYCKALDNIKSLTFDIEEKEDQITKVQKCLATLKKQLNDKYETIAAERQRLDKLADIKVDLTKKIKDFEEANPDFNKAIDPKIITFYIPDVFGSIFD